MKLLLDHSIVGQELTTLSINKDREFAACRICGAIFQSRLNTKAISDEEYAANPDLELAAAIETSEWRTYHNRKHSEQEHLALAASGLTLTPEAAYKLAPFGIVPIADALINAETSCALLEAPRVPADDAEE